MFKIGLNLNFHRQVFNITYSITNKQEMKFTLVLVLINSPYFFGTCRNFSVLRLFPFIRRLSRDIHYTACLN